jgi:hypothetical protein
MKRVSSYFPIALLHIPLLCISFISFSQVTKSEKDKKEVKESKETLEYQTLGELLDTKKIAYQTEFVQTSTGMKIYNVVQINGADLYIRCENPPNTSGRFSGARDNSTPNISLQTGVFFEGTTENWDLIKNLRKKFYTIKFNVLDKGGIQWGEVTIKAYADKSATIEIRSRSGSMIYSDYTGKVRPL